MNNWINNDRSNEKNKLTKSQISDLRKLNISSVCIEFMKWAKQTWFVLQIKDIHELPQKCKHWNGNSLLCHIVRI